MRQVGQLLMYLVKFIRRLQHTRLLEIYVIMKVVRRIDLNYSVPKYVLFFFLIIPNTKKTHSIVAFPMPLYPCFHQMCTCLCRSNVLMFRRKTVNVVKLK